MPHSHSELQIFYQHLNKQLHRRRTRKSTVIPGCTCKESKQASANEKEEKEKEEKEEEKRLFIANLLIPAHTSISNSHHNFRVHRGTIQCLITEFTIYM